MKPKTWITLIVLALLAFALVKLAPSRVRYMQFNYFLGEEANEASKLSNEEIVHDIARKIKELNLPLDPQSIYWAGQQPDGYDEKPYVLLERNPEYFQINAQYQVTVTFVGKLSVTLNFAPDIYAEASSNKE